jgi:orotidine-5'-phosphate decarboxylase
MMDPFGARLHAAMAAHGPVCAGVDPHASLLEAWGLPDDADGLRRFTEVCVTAWAGQVSVVKPQSAFFERHGSRGIAVLEDAVRDFRDAGTLVLLDVKRGDIGSTAQAYAEAYLDPASPLAVDAITASPYLGVGSLTPMFDLAVAHGAGVFVLALTSNPEGAEVQRARTTVGPTEGASVAETVLGALAGLNRGATPLGSFGAVVGATLEPHPALTAALDMGGPLLLPGVGAQGGSIESVKALVGDLEARALPSISRGLLAAGPDPEALRSAAARANAEAATGLRG